MTRSVPLRRATTLGLALLVCLAGVGVRLGYVQGVRADAYSAEARSQRVRRIVLPARRGQIVDRTGTELALSVPARTIYANPREVADPARTAAVLAPLLGRSPPALEELLRRPTTFVYLSRRTSVDVGERVARLDLPGIGVIEESRRLYPSGLLAAPVLGAVGADGRGLDGLEYGYDSLLRGRDGYRVLEEDPLGRRIPQGVYVDRPPLAGSDLRLTLDADLELASEQALHAGVVRTHALGGMLVALDPRTGEILAMANEPSFDPNDVVHADPRAMRNRAVTDAFEPGSVNKVITASAALAEGLVSPGERIWVPPVLVIAGQRFIEERVPSRSLDLRQILTYSSNVGTIEIARRLGAQRLDWYFRLFGYGRTTGLGFPGESAGILPSAARWGTSLPTMAIGQGLSVTALQIAQVYAAIANDGVSVEPRLVASWTDGRGIRHDVNVPRARRVVPAPVAREVRDMLRSVVTSGTGVDALVPGYDVAGKTGTARKSVAGVGYQGYFATFAGMLPASAPRLVVVVVLDDPHPIEGGLAAAPVFADMATQAVRLLHIPPGP